MFSIFDATMILIILIFAIIGYVRGAVGAILSFVGGIVSAIIASVLGSNIAPWIYDNFFEHAISEDVTTAVNSAVNSGTTGIGDSIADILPRAISEFSIETGIIDVLNNITGNTTSELSSIACDIVLQSVEPVYVKIISICTTIVLFFVLSAVVGVLCHLSGIVNKIPLVGSANKIIGAVMGLIYGGILVVVAVFAMSVIVPCFDQDNSFKENIQEQSIFFSIVDNSGVGDYKELLMPTDGVGDYKDLLMPTESMEEATEFFE